jgi:prepilin-type N-terminal cleavage/methylation domain-containing protein
VKGFSLIELMVACAVAAILVLLAAPNFSQQQATLQLRQALADLHGIETDMVTATGACAAPPPATLSQLPVYDYSLALVAPPPAAALCSGATLNATTGAWSQITYVDGAGVGQFSSVSGNGLQLTATLGNSTHPLIRGQQIIVTGTQTGNGIVWSCTVPAGFTISHCP